MSGLDQDTMRLADRRPVPDTTDNVAADVNNPCCDWYRDPDNRTPAPRRGSLFGGAHPGGMQSAFCDGSVRVIAWSIENAVFARVTDRRDGQTYELP